MWSSPIWHLLSNGRERPLNKYICHWELCPITKVPWRIQIGLRVGIVDWKDYNSFQFQKLVCLLIWDLKANEDAVWKMREDYFEQIEWDILFPEERTHSTCSEIFKWSRCLEPCCAKSLQSCLTLCDPMDCSLPGSSVHGFSRQGYWRVGLFRAQVSKLL